MDIQILAQRFYQYSSFIKGFSKCTIGRYKYVINYYCKQAQIHDLSQVSEENIRALFFHGRTARNWKVNTYLVYYKSLKVFFKWCIREGYMQQNPIDCIEVPRLEKLLPPKLTKQESLRLLEVVYNYPYNCKFLRTRNHAIFTTFIFAGLRRQELLNLKFTDVDFENSTLFIRQGKGNKDRVVPISLTLAQSLKRYLDDRARMNKTCPEFFTSVSGNYGLTSIGLKRLVDSIRSASGLNFTVHKLRHSFATFMLEGGCDIYSLARMMGHSDIKTTTIYLYASVEHLRSQITKHPLNDLVR